MHWPRFCQSCSLLVLSSLAFVAVGVSQQPLDPAPGTPPRVGPPLSEASAADLEARGDALRTQKLNLDALDYYRAALRKAPAQPGLFNKIGITELQLLRYRDAKKDFERAIKLDRDYADAYNNLGVVMYLQRKHKQAISQYRKALGINEQAASFHSNLAAAYFARKEFDKAVWEYGRALALDPEVLDRTSRSGVAAQLASPEDRAQYDYVLAKLYARSGDLERALRHLRRAIEEGYGPIANVYKDSEFSVLRSDSGFQELMADKPLALPN